MSLNHLKSTTKRFEQNRVKWKLARHRASLKRLTRIQQHGATCF